MSRSWWYVLGLMVAGSVIIHLFPYLIVSVAVNLGILAASYFILRRDPFIDLRATMLFILGMTVINLLSAFGKMSGMMANFAFIALLVWSMAGGGRSR